MSDDNYFLQPELRLRATPPEGILVDQRNAEIMVLNELALRVLQLLGENPSRAALLSSLAQEYDAELDAITADVDDFLAELQQRDLLKAES